MRKRKLSGRTVCFFGNVQSAAQNDPEAVSIHSSVVSDVILFANVNQNAVYSFLDTWANFLTSHAANG